MTSTETTYMSAAEVAKEIRKALKTDFADTRFGVRSKTYSGGASIRVYWTDGPTTAEVDAVVKPFEGSSFDGMIDLKTSNGPLDALDGARSCADFIFTERTISDELWNEIAARVAEYYHCELPARMNSWNVFVTDNRKDHHWSFEATVRRAAEGKLGD